MIEMDFTPVERGLEVRIAPPYELLAWYLTSDLQMSTAIRPVLENVRLVLEGRSEAIEWDGNGYVLTPGPRTCRIECIYDDTVVEVPSVEMISVLERWLAHKLQQQGER